MGFYAQRPGRMAGQLVVDGAVVVGVMLWALVAVAVDRAVSSLAGPARDTAASARKLSGSFSDAADQASQLPGLGESLRRPFDSASGSLGEVIASANQTAETIDSLATLLGWLVFLIPVSLILGYWLPRRIRFFRHARAAQTLLDSSADLDLFALRAMAAQPLPVLARVSADPVAAWRAGDRTVIARLAELELQRTGLRLPLELRPGREPGRPPRSQLPPEAPLRQGAELPHEPGLRPTPPPGDHGPSSRTSRDDGHGSGSRG